MRCAAPGAKKGPARVALVDICRQSSTSTPLSVSVLYVARYKLGRWLIVVEDTC